MAQSLKFGNGTWATKKDSTLAYNDENGNFKPLPFDFTRSSTATRVNKKGLIEVVENGRPRIDYTDNTDGALLLEPSRINLNTLSDPTDAQKFSTSYASVTFQDDFNWALGSLLENAIVFGDNSTTRYSYYSNTVSSGTVYSLSFFIKMDDNSIPIPATDFLLVLAGTSIASGYNIDDYGNNVYRVSVTGTAGASNTANGVLKVASHSAKTFKITGFQIEAGSYPTSYIPTSGSAVTRVEETCNGAGNSEVFNDTEGVIFVETEPFIDGDFESQYISLSDGTSGNDFVTIQHRDSGQLRVYAGGFASENIQFLVNLDMAQNLKIAVQYKESDYKLFVNGTEYSIYSSGGNQPSLSGLSQLDFNIKGGTHQKWKAKTKQVKIYNTTLSDAELQALTQ